LYMHGVDEPSARLRVVPAASEAAKAGIRGGDTVVAVNGNQIRSWTELRWQVMHAAVDKSDARLELRSANGGSYAATLPAAVVGLLDVETDVMAELGLDLWRPQSRIEKVMPDGAGQRAGLQDGDLVLRADGQPVVDGIAFIEAVRASP